MAVEYGSSTAFLLLLLPLSRMKHPVKGAHQFLFTYFCSLPYSLNPSRQAPI